MCFFMIIQVFNHLSEIRTILAINITGNSNFLWKYGRTQLLERNELWRIEAEFL